MPARTELIKKDLRKKPKDPVLLKDLARQLLSEKNYKEARAKYRLALLYNPRLLIEILLDFESALDSDPNDISLRLLLPDLFLYMGDVESAVGELEEILEIDPKRAEVYNVLGKLYLQKQDLDAVIKLLEQAMRLGIKEVNITEMLAGTYVEKGRIDDAIALYRGLVEKVPENKNYFRILGELFERRSDFNEAAKCYVGMLDGAPGFISEVIHKLSAVTQMAPENTFVRENLADMYIKAIRPDLAVEQCRKIFEIDKGKIDLVISKYQDLLHLYPDEPNTLIAFGEALIEKSEYSLATEKFNSLIRYKDNYLNDAIAGYKKVLERYPKHSMAHEFLGDAYVKAGNTEKALNEYLVTLGLDITSGKGIVQRCQEITKLNPNMILAHHVLGEAYITCGEFRSAIEEAEFIIYLDKNYSPAHVILGDGYLGLGNVLKAIESYTAAIRLDPFNTKIHEKNKKAHLISFDDEIKALKKRTEEDPWRLGVHLDLAKAYILKGSFDEGIKELQVAVKDPARAPFAYNTLGRAFVEEGRFDLGVIQFEKAINITPGELRDFLNVARFNLGAAYEATGEIEKSISEYEKILQEDVEFGALQERIRILSNSGPTSLRNKSIAALVSQLGEKKIIGLLGINYSVREITKEALNISFGQDHNNFGFEHFMKGRYRAAEEEFELAIQLDAEFCSALNNLAVMYFGLGKLEVAETRLSLALSVDPNFAVIYNNLGVLNYLKGNYKEAEKKLQKALEINPNLSSAYINLGDVYYLQGQCEQALSLWRKIKDFDPLSAFAQRRLAFRIIEQ